MIRIETPNYWFTPRYGKFLDILVGDHNDRLATEESFDGSSDGFDRDIVQDKVIGELVVHGPIRVRVEDEGVRTEGTGPFRFTVAGGTDKEKGLWTFGSWMLIDES